MKITFRTGVFETNSSSTHSLIMLSEEEYKKLQAEELYISTWDEKLVTKEEVLEKAKKAGYDDIESFNENRDEYQTLDEYFDDEYLETFEETYTTKGGEKVYAIGKYGYN